MSDEELQALVQSMHHGALGYQNDTLSIERQQALDYYFGRPLGTEVAGRSQVVERTLMEAVEWVMPQIMRSLQTADNLAEFRPRNAQDVAQAKQETDYINYLIMEKNEGFMELHDAIKDALLLKNGYIKRYWEEYEETMTESFTGLNEEAVTLLMQELEADHDEVEILGKDERTESIEMPDGITEIPVIDLKLRITDKKGRVCIEAAPSEEILVSPRCRGSLQKTDFVGHVPPMTRSDLIAMGMDEDFVEALPAKGLRRTKPEEIARDTQNQNAVDTYAPNNPSQDEIDYLEAYVRADYDGDGKAELRKVVLAGGKLPPGDEWNEEIEEVPFSYGTPTRMPHRHIGISLHDFVQDVQLVRSTLLRQMLDNVYLTNNQRPIVNERVSQDDLALSAPGSPIRVDGTEPVGDSITYAPATPILAQVMPVLDYLEDRKEQRTGVGKNNTIIDSDVIRDSANETITTAFNAANQRIEMYIRMLAETLIKDLVLGVHGLTIRHQDEPDEVELRGEWVTINPADWKERHSIMVKVGLGMGTAQEQRQNLMFIASVQEKAAAAGCVQPENFYALASDIIASVPGFRGNTKYLTDPAKIPPKQPQPPPAVQVAQANAQAKMQVSTLEHQQEMARIQAQAQTQTSKDQFTAQLDAATAREKAQLDAQQQQLKTASDLHSRLTQTEVDAIVSIIKAALLGKAAPDQITADTNAAMQAGQEMFNG